MKSPYTSARLHNLFAVKDFNQKRPVYMQIDNTVHLTHDVSLKDASIPKLQMLSHPQNAFCQSTLRLYLFASLSWHHELPIWSIPHATHRLTTSSTLLTSSLVGFTSNHSLCTRPHSLHAPLVALCAASSR